MTNNNTNILSNYSYLTQLFTITKQEKITTMNIRLIGSRLSAKTMQVLKFIILMQYSLKGQISTGIWRYTPKGAQETYEELENALFTIYGLDKELIYLNSTNKKIKLNDNEIKVNGLMSNTKSKTPKLGSARKGVKKLVQINVFEECNEFKDEKQIEMIKQASGGAKYIINIFIANPWIISNWYVKPFARRNLFNEKILREEGEVIKVETKALEKTLDIWHITNHRVNTYLEESQHRMLTSLWDLDQNLAMVADLGLPGVAEGLIYAPVMHLIENANYTSPIEMLIGGIDWGTSTGENGSATAMELGRIGKDWSFLQYEWEYYHSNANSYYKSDLQIQTELINKLNEWLIKPDISALVKRHRITIYVDNASSGIKDILQDKLIEMYPQWSDFVFFEKTPNKMLVPERIDYMKHIMTTKRLKVDKANCPMLWSEWEQSLWDDTKMVKDKPTRIKEGDHCLDASEYAIGTNIKTFAHKNYIQAKYKNYATMNNESDW